MDNGRMDQNHFENTNRQFLRSSAIKARNALTEEERIAGSAEICKKISELWEYKNAKTVMIYKWIRGEVRLNELEKGGAFFDAQKILIYPLCIDDGIMFAIRPGSKDGSWVKGAFGIMEPVREKGTVIAPEEIDLVICPLSGFDEELNRLGMGSGYYDRFLPQCKNAVRIGAAFDVQKLDKIPAQPHDMKMDIVITEKHQFVGPEA